MKILYHPKRILGFEPYVAPDNFDRKAQPVDIYDVFERYYKNHRSARYICSVMPTIVNTFFGAEKLPLYPGYYNVNLTGYSFLVGYELGGNKYRVNITPTSASRAYNKLTTSVSVASTAGFPDTGMICADGFLGGYNPYPKFTYTSKDETTFYGASQQFATGGSLSISYVFDFTGTTNRWYITNHSTITETNMVVDIVAKGIDWIYSAKCKGISVNQAPANAPSLGITEVKYVHCHSLDCITTFRVGWNGSMFGAPLTGTLHLPTIPSVIASDGAPAGLYESCIYITKLDIKSNVNTLGTKTFQNCTGLDGTLTIPNTLTTIGISAFKGCNKLDTLDLGTGVQAIGNSAFQSCTQLTGTLTFPTSLTTIGTLAFYGCTAYTGTLTIASGITSIGQGAFGDDNFTDIDVTANAGYEDVDNVLYEISTRTALHSIKSNTGTITFQSNTLIIGDYCCLRNLRTGTLTVPDSVTRVGIYAFYDCDGFTALVLETSSSALEMIDDHAFRYCGNIAGTLTIPNSVTLIDQYAFESVPKITAIVIGNGVVTIGAGAFYNDIAVTSITFGTGLVTIGADAFRQMTAISENLVIPNSVETIGATAFYNNTARTGTLTLGTGLKTIGGSAFGQVPFTGTLAIPSLVTAIGEGAFHNNNFSAVASSASGFTVSDYVLYDETTSGQIKAHTSARGYAGTLTLKTGTTSILYLCFYNNTNRTGTVSILSTVTLIRTQAFESANAFTGLAFSGTPTIATIESKAFYNCKAMTGTLTLPASLGTAANSIAANAFTGSTVANRPQFTVCNSYNATQPGAATNAFAFRDAANASVAIPLHIPTGSTSYIAAPWTNTAIFSSVTADL